MLFKQEKPEHVITIDCGGKPKPMPHPEVGKIYHSFDDGKIRLSRLEDWLITKKIDLDHDTIRSKLKEDLQKVIEDEYWIFKPEQTIIYKAYRVHDGKKCGDSCYFLRTKSEGWFGCLCDFLMWCELDVDNRWYNELIKEEKKLNKRKK